MRDKPRDLRFRVWLHEPDDESAGEMLDWGGIWERGLVSPDGFLEDESTEWMQYTGLKDANGKEIWEGDLLRRPNGLVYRVYWPGGDGCSYHIDRNYIDGFTIAPLELVHDELEVVGNVWQNWELFASEENMKQSNDADEDGVLSCGHCGAEKTLIDA